ncbi:hypothetical protein GUJ93_ZPchr0008g11620 [Zizania palustris]|uniref:Uncharacterized protein n=1 Tax=Zizania palustris TaxID=103762 RepID=A0A8J5R4M7_ZIZPA|nr:hypothetical protein GUJ93_ZPchr0008g11620 [Zizania palustris]
MRGNVNPSRQAEDGVCLPPGRRRRCSERAEPRIGVCCGARRLLARATGVGGRAAPAPARRGRAPCGPLPDAVSWRRRASVRVVRVQSLLPHAGGDAEDVRPCAELWA